MRPTFSALLALSAWQILSVAAQAGPDCMPNCASQRRNDFAGFQCANADDAACLCANEGFKTAYRECARGCQAPEGEIDPFLSNNFCTGQAPAADQPSSEPAAQPSSTAPPQPETTAQPESTTESKPEPTQESSSVVKDQGPVETPVAETSSASKEAESSTTPAPESTATKAKDETETSSSSDAASTSSEKTSSGAGAGATSGVEKDDGEPDKEKEDEGLSKAAIIGIGVGAGAAALGLAGLLIFLCCRRKRAKKDIRPFIEISKPMPADGAGSYTGRRDPFAEKRGDVMEMQSNRYEDMLPRTEPRTVV